MKKIFKRTTYLIYYFKQLNWEMFNKFFKHVKNIKNISNISLWLDILISVYKYNIGLMDYFTFRFFEKDSQERNNWVGIGYKYEYDLYMCPKSTRDILENKIEFYKAYEPFIRHEHCTIEDIDKRNEKAKSVFNNKSSKIVIKDALGQCGWDVEVIKKDDFTIESLGVYMKSKSFNLAESFIEQHPDINRLSPSGLNTVRMITHVNNKGDVDFLGARMRISVNSHVDNLASGNIAASIDLMTGKICRPGVYSDITKPEVTKHPITGIELVGYQIPFWKEIMEVSGKIALHRPENRGVGWDIAVTKDGPDFIEGNHNWCKILWQIPDNEGKKHILEKNLIDLGYSL
jgi:hypothetical protein